MTLWWAEGISFTDHFRQNNSDFMARIIKNRCPEPLSVLKLWLLSNIKCWLALPVFRLWLKANIYMNTSIYINRSIVLNTGCPKKNAWSCFLAITPLWKGLGRKVGGVLKTSGDFLCGRHKNFPNWPFRSWENWVQRWQLKLKNIEKKLRKFF